VDVFEDVHTDDFITAVGRVGRRALRRLDLDPYPTGLTGDKDPCTEQVYAEYMVILCLKY
jgi:hypothetical protein